LKKCLKEDKITDMIKIRLLRAGKKNDPVYKIVAIDSKKSRAGSALDILGHWHKRENSLTINRKRVNEWLKNGAQMSVGARKLLEK
jgi:small subunit ribosomal protein S16